MRLLLIVALAISTAAATLSSIPYSAQRRLATTSFDVFDLAEFQAALANTACTSDDASCEIAITNDINVTSPLLVNGSVTIRSATTKLVILDGGGLSQIMVVATQADVALSRLLFLNGSADRAGAAISIGGSATVTDCEFRGHYVGGDSKGGALAIDGTATLSNSEFVDNEAYGGAAAAVGGFAKFVGCKVRFPDAMTRCPCLTPFPMLWHLVPQQLRKRAQRWCPVSGGGG